MLNERIYPLLTQAPKDYMSEEFLQFLRDNNAVVMDAYPWLIIENCKYHTAEKAWYTAFWTAEFKPEMLNLTWLQFHFPDFNLLVKASSRRSVKRFHVHLIGDASP